MGPSKQRSLFAICPSLVESPGGIQRYCVDLYRALQLSDPSLSIHFYTKLDKPISLALFPKSWGAGSVSRKFRNLCLILKIIQEAARHKPTAILVAHLNFAPVALLLKIIFGTRYAVIIYGIEAWEIKGFIRRRALLKSDRIWSISQVTMKRAIESAGLNSNKCSLLPCAVDTDRFANNPPSQQLAIKYGFSNHTKVILTVARLSADERYKGHDSVIRALPALRKEIPEIRYLVVGDGTDRARAELLAKQLNVADIVIFAGFIPDDQLIEYYNLCDVFALPGNGEGFGIAFLEALSCGKPCIGGADDGSRDPLQDGELGILVKYGDIRELEIALSNLLLQKNCATNLLNPEYLREMTAKEFGKKKFNELLLQERIPELCAE